MGHTPGPWEVHKCKRYDYEKNYSQFEILQPLFNEEGEYEGKLGGYNIVIGKPNCLQGYILKEADARLIATAPEMHNLLKRLVEEREFVHITEIQELLDRIEEIEGDKP